MTDNPWGDERERITIEAAKDPYVDINAVATHFGVVPTTVRNWIRDGQIPALRLPGGSYRLQIKKIEKHFRESS